MTESKYDPSYADQAYKLVLLFGSNQSKLAEFFEVTSATIMTWKERHAEFGDAIRRGGTAANAEIVKALYTRAIGYDKTLNKAGEATEYHYPPDTNACFKWLSLRMRKDPDSLWTEKEEDTEKPKRLEFDDVEIARKVAFILAKGIRGETLDVAQDEDNPVSSRTIVKG